MTDLTERTVAVTGATGLLGWHLRCALHSYGVADVRPIDRALFSCQEELQMALASCDAVVHLAGVNRGAPDQIESTNVALASCLVEALRQTDMTPHVVFANSIRRGEATPYGRGKAAAAAVLSTWATETGARFTDLVLPHVFGELGRPFYNSVVATFCYQLANGDEPHVLDDNVLELVHTQDVADEVVRLIGTRTAGEVRVRGRAMLVSELLDKLASFAREYIGGDLPDVRSPLHRALFNVYRSYLFPKRLAVPLVVRSDKRGSLAEAVKTPSGGQTFFSSTRPGVSRGNHYHRRKIERFVVVNGTAVIRFRRLFSSDTTQVEVRGSDPAGVDIPTLHTHAITNVGGDDLLTIFWADEVFDPKNPDTTPEFVDA
jgi:UDP-2-acetamido-2,6-beta-L-arabino-hexul-4-ose reductase